MAARMSRHGSIASYTNDQCRCPDCRTAWREYRRSHRQPPTTSSGRAVVARAAAVDQLIANHPDEWAELHAQQRRRHGLE